MKKNVNGMYFDVFILAFLFGRYFGALHLVACNQLQYFYKYCGALHLYLIKKIKMALRCRAPAYL